MHWLDYRYVGVNKDGYAIADVVFALHRNHKDSIKERQ